MFDGFRPGLSFEMQPETHTPSCPGLSRASTSLLHQARKVVDGRVIGAKQSFVASPGHDENVRMSK
jgi:hypothetical protein